MVIILLGRASSGVRVSVGAFVFDCASPLSQWVAYVLKRSLKPVCVCVCVCHAEAVASEELLRILQFVSLDSDENSNCVHSIFVIRSRLASYVQSLRNEVL